MLEFSIPARGIIGLRNALLTATEGEAIIAHRFKGYEPYKGASRLHVQAASLVVSRAELLLMRLINCRTGESSSWIPGEEIYMRAGDRRKPEAR